MSKKRVHGKKRGQDQGPRRLTLIREVNGAQETLGQVEEDEARRLIKEGKVTLVGRVGKRALKLIVAAGEKIRFAASEIRHKKYSHRHETAENPTGVWTLIHIRSTQSIFLANLVDIAGPGVVQEVCRDCKRPYPPQQAEEHRRRFHSRNRNAA